LLQKLGFSPESARMVAENIVVDPARRVRARDGGRDAQAKAHLRTRVEKGG
jgi:hypothetical protein